jgi:bifunctional enzyme CysN/CysC
MSKIMERKTPMPIVIVGHVDHGKSTLVGRLLHDTDSLPEGKLEEVQKACKKRGVAMEWSFLLDAFQAERDQAITIDTTQIWFSTEYRPYVIIDAPGHREFLKNMVSGAAQADAAILVVDAEEGLQEQTKRHAYMLSLLGVRQVAIAVNKMDVVKYDDAVFAKVSKEVDGYLKSIGVTASHIVPISAREGDMITIHSDKMHWYKGKTLCEVLDAFEVDSPPLTRALRFPIQDVYRFDEKRVLVGRIETGVLHKGDTVLFSPTNETAVVTSIEVWPEDENRVSAQAGESIGIRLDQRIFVERGHVCSHEQEPPMLSNVFRANIFWLAKKPLKVGNTYKIRLASFETTVSVQSIERMVDTDDLKQENTPTDVARNSVAEVTFRAQDMVPIDPHSDNARMGRVVLYEEYDIAGGGLIHMEGYADQRQNAPKSKNITEVEHLVSDERRHEIKGHTGGIFWFTGLSGAGKSTLAMAVEQELTRRGYHTYVLDGDNVRYGLNSDLGFSPEDRAENIRRIGEVAALMADAGLIVISAFISPYQADRDKARSARPQQFNEIFVSADISTCEKRDPKGLYKKARAGEIKQFTGIDAPYEAPINPELVVNTSDNDVSTCVEQIIQYVEGQISLSANMNKEKAFAS